MTDRDRKQQFRRGPGKAPDKGRESGRRPPWRGREASPDGPAILYGWHTVVAALANPQRHIRKLMLTENAARRLADDKIETREIVQRAKQMLMDQRGLDEPEAFEVIQQSAMRARTRMRDVAQQILKGEFLG